jgi:hypothetical protein
MLHFLVHTIFSFYINGVLNCKCPAPGPKSIKWNQTLENIKFSVTDWILGRKCKKLPVHRPSHAIVYKSKRNRRTHQINAELQYYMRSVSCCSIYVWANRRFFFSTDFPTEATFSTEQTISSTESRFFLSDDRRLVVIITIVTISPSY